MDSAGKEVAPQVERVGRRGEKLGRWDRDGAGGTTVRPGGRGGGRRGCGDGPLGRGGGPLGEVDGRADEEAGGAGGEMGWAGVERARTGGETRCLDGSWAGRRAGATRGRGGGGLGRGDGASGWEDGPSVTEIDREVRRMSVRDRARSASWRGALRRRSPGSALARLAHAAAGASPRGHVYPHSWRSWITSPGKSAGRRSLVAHEGEGRYVELSVDHLVPPGVVLGQVVEIAVRQGPLEPLRGRVHHAASILQGPTLTRRCAWRGPPRSLLPAGRRSAQTLAAGSRGR